MLLKLTFVHVVISDPHANLLQLPEVHHIVVVAWNIAENLGGLLDSMFNLSLFATNHLDNNIFQVHATLPENGVLDVTVDEKIAAVSHAERLVQTLASFSTATNLHAIGARAFEESTLDRNQRL
jgi:hypothetical protein